MTPEPCLLLIEDEEKWQRLLGFEVKRAGVSYGVAASLAEAMAAIERRRYDAVLLDLSLSGSVTSPTSGEGEEIAQALSGLDEGTAVLIVSATATPERASRISMRFGTPAIAKGEGGVSGLSTVIGTMTERGVRYRPEASASSVQAVMRGDMDGTSWEHSLLSGAPRVSGGVRAVQQFLSNLVQPFWPLVPHASRAALGYPSDDSSLLGAYWSRMIAQPVIVALGDEPSIDRLAAAGDIGASGRSFSADATLRRRSKGRLHGLVRLAVDVDRSEFVPAINRVSDAGDDWLNNYFSR